MDYIAESDTAVLAGATCAGVLGTFVSPFVWLPFKSIEPVGNAASLEIEVFRKENPKLCEIMGV